ALLPSLMAVPPGRAETGAKVGAKTLQARAPSRPPSDDLFQQQIQPILARNCYGCHGDGKTSGFDARSRDGLLRGGSRGPALVPGRADASRLYRYIAGLEKPAMPPGGPLLPAEIAAIKAWIEAGAPAG